MVRLRRRPRCPRGGRLLCLTGENLLMQLTQGRAWINAELLNQPLANPKISVQGIRLATIAELRQHQLPSQPFVERIRRLRRG
ncbi:hypothetical protein MYIN104542_29730 [Mycobacterium intermedium]